MAPNNGIVNRLRGFDAKHYAATDRYARIIEKLFNMASDELAQAARNASYDPSAVFSFNDFPATRRQAQQILSRLVGQLEHVIDSGTKAEWLAACDKNDAFINAILRSSKLSRAEVEQYEDRNLEALRAFQSRKTNGLGLSHRVWNYAGNFVNEVELGIDAALGDGTPAANLARSLRQHLKEPERIYRRFRIKTGEDENGNPIYGREWKRREYDPETGTFRWVKDDPADYHPGTGVYRSSVKNAMRLARTEINMAYREAEYLRWQQLDFVVGFRVCLSNNHTIINPKTGKKEPLTDICDELAGDYPKTFKFLGWHPNCRCYVVPIMEDYDEYNKRRAGRLKAIVRRESYTSLPSRRQVTDVPPNFRKYIESIADRSKGWKSQPYYIRDNFVGGRIAGGLKPSIPTKTMNDVQPCTDFDAEIASLRRWAFAYGLDLSNINALRTAGNRAALKQALDTIKAIQVERSISWNEAREQIIQLNAEIAQYPEIAQKAKEVLADNEVRTSNYYADCISRLKAAFTSLVGKLTKAKATPATTTTDTPHPAVKTSYTDNAEVAATITTIGKSKKWFANAKTHTLSTETDPKNNGSTDRRGEIWLTKDRLDRVKAALGKIGRGESATITKDEADAMATYWHEITHNRHKGTESAGSKTSKTRSFMELANEFVARKTLPDFYKALGCGATPQPQFITNRTTTGYNGMVTNYDFVIGKLGLDSDKVLRTVKKHLFKKDYSKQKDGLIGGLKAGGIKKADGKKATAKEIAEIVSLCQSGSRKDIEDYLKNNGFLVDK